MLSDTLCSVDIQELDGKERNIVKYLGGYVFHYIYIDVSYHNESSILLAGKSTLPETDSSTDNVVICWKVIPQAMKIIPQAMKNYSTQQ